MGYGTKLQQMLVAQPIYNDLGQVYAPQSNPRVLYPGGFVNQTEQALNGFDRWLEAQTPPLQAGWDYSGSAFRGTRFSQPVRKSNGRI